MSTTTIDKAETTHACESQKWRRPRYNVFESEDAFDVQVNVPGVERSGVDVSLKEDTLSITAIRSESDTQGWRPLRQELSQSNFRLNLRLNVPIKENKIKARVENGLLSLQLPKADALKARKIQID